MDNVAPMLISLLEKILRELGLPALFVSALRYQKPVVVPKDRRELPSPCLSEAAVRGRLPCGWS